MAKRQNTARKDGGEQAGSVKHAGSRLLTPDALAHAIEEGRALLDKGLSSEAETLMASVIESAGHAPGLSGQARVVLSEALEWQGRYHEAFESVRMYELTDARTDLDTETWLKLRVRLGLACNYTGDYPKAIALLNATLREATEEGNDAESGAACVALARVYRSINESTISRDFLNKALEFYRHEGDWRGLGEVYLGFGIVDVYEGDYESALEQYEQALKLVGDRAAPQMLGRIYANMGGACWFLKRPHDGIRYLEKAVRYYERTEHKVNAAVGYNNLGINLTLVGEWERAQEALKRSLELAFEVDRHNAHVPMILNSLGELRILMGELEEAQSLLQRALTLATEHGNKWYEGQARRTLGRCLLAVGDDARALAEGKAAFRLAEKIGDRQALCESHLLLAEACLRHDNMDECAEQLHKVSTKTTTSVADLAIAGAAQRLEGLLQVAQKDGTRAVYHFSRSVSIFEMLGDQHSGALAHYELGRAYALLQPERAATYLSHAAAIFRNLGARLDLKRAEEAIAALADDHSREPEMAQPAPAFSPIMTLRLAEASALRGLLLRELATIVYQETGAQKVLIAEADTEGQFKVVVAHGYHSEEEKESVTAALKSVTEGRTGERAALLKESALVRLEAENALPALMVISPREVINQPGGMELDSLVRVAMMGLELSALREQGRTAPGGQKQRAQTVESVLPGFIHSSPAMQGLVDEIHKIRSSDVTVLVTGESGTGKELVARAIHTLSNRRDQSFIAFNCTAVPRELSESYLFGYRKGAFTGAASDSQGVLRAASGGTLFLDEIGDLPLDIQPKLLRFLQEGEIQPLGAQRPVKVDVRVIAATNCDLEKMVADRSFREDLYYRLNVIRLSVPPLRERRSEIQSLIYYYIAHYSQKFKRRDIQITPQAIDLLMVGEWPGNVRQLCNELQRIVARAEDGAVITPQQLGREILPLASSNSASMSQESPTLNATVQTPPLTAQSLLPEAVEQLERQMIAEALRRHGGNVTRAARDLGLTRRGLQLKLARYEIETNIEA